MLNIPLTVQVILLLIAALMFLLEAASAPKPAINKTAAGLLCWVLSVLVSFIK